jgi:hypothetical protein
VVICAMPVPLLLSKLTDWPLSMSFAAVMAAAPYAVPPLPAARPLWERVYVKVVAVTLATTNRPLYADGVTPATKTLSPWLRLCGADVVIVATSLAHVADEICVAACVNVPPEPSAISVVAAPEPGMP